MQSTDLKTVLIALFSDETGPTDEAGAQLLAVVELRQELRIYSGDQ